MSSVPRDAFVQEVRLVRRVVVAAHISRAEVASMIGSNVFGDILGVV